MKKLIPLFAIMVFWSCATNKYSNLTQVRPGMKSQELIALMGEPQNVQFEQETQAWQYCKTGVTQNMYVVYFLYNDTVMSSETYYKACGSMCKACFSRVDWTQSANTINVNLKKTNY